MGAAITEVITIRELESGGAENIQLNVQYRESNQANA